MIRTWGKKTFRVSTRLLAEHEYLSYVSIRQHDLICTHERTACRFNVHPDSPAAAYASRTGTP